MNYEISLTASRSTATEEADKFIDLLTSRGFSAIQGETRNNYNGDKVYIHFTLSPMEFQSHTGYKGGRPRKLTDEQLEEIKQRLTDSCCNKSALAREYGVSYQTIHKICHKLACT